MRHTFNLLISSSANLNPLNTAESATLGRIRVGNTHMQAREPARNDILTEPSATENDSVRKTMCLARICIYSLDIRVYDALREGC